MGVPFFSFLSPLLTLFSTSQVPLALFFATLLPSLASRPLSPSLASLALSCLSPLALASLFAPVAPSLRLSSNSHCSPPIGEGAPSPFAPCLSSLASCLLPLASRLSPLSPLAPFPCLMGYKSPPFSGSEWDFLQKCYDFSYNFRLFFWRMESLRYLCPRNTN